jgi:hypothetical protein
VYLPIGWAKSTRRRCAQPRRDRTRVGFPNGREAGAFTSRHAAPFFGAEIWVRGGAPDTTNLQSSEHATIPTGRVQGMQEASILMHGDYVHERMAVLILLKGTSMQVVVGPVLTRKGSCAFDCWMPAEGPAAGTLTVASKTAITCATSKSDPATRDVRITRSPAAQSMTSPGQSSDLRDREHHARCGTPLSCRLAESCHLRWQCQVGSGGG